MTKVIQFPIVAEKTIGESVIDTVNLRELHAFLEVSTPFDKWIARRVEEYAFVEGLDFTTILSKSTGGRRRRVYFGCLDMAKELSMVEKTDKGKQARRYFIECEKQLRSGSIGLPKTRAEALRQLADKIEENEALRLQNDHQTDQIDKLENLFRSGMTIAQFGRMLNGVNVMALSEYVEQGLGWIYNGSRSGKSKKWRAHNRARDKYVTETEFQVGAHGREAFMKPEVRLLAEGAKQLYQLYLKGRLPMKKTWNGEFTHLKITASGQVDLLTGVQAA